MIINASRIFVGDLGLRNDEVRKKGRPKKFTGPVDLKSLDDSIFETVTLEDFTLHSASVWAVSLKREVKVVIADYIDPEKKAQTRKVFFGTDTDMSAIDIFDIYRCRFQIEFLYRDSKQFTRLCNCQSRDVNAMDFAFNMSLSTINVARQFGKDCGMDLSVSDVKLLPHNAAMVERIFSMFGESPNLMKNNTDFKELLFYGLRAAI